MQSNNGIQKEQEKSSIKSGVTQAGGRELYQKVSHAEAAALKITTVDSEGLPAEYTRIFLPHQRLILLGGGYISFELCRFAAELDFEVIVVDDRKEFARQGRFLGASQVICGDYPTAIRRLQITPYDFVAVMTRGHAYDGFCLRSILDGGMPYYLGLVGSRKRTSLLKESLEAEGYAREMLEQIHTPIGLDIQARTPAEIGISILAQLIACRNSQTPKIKGMLDFTNSDLQLLKFMAETEKPYMLAVVIAKEGSAPVSTGAMMAVNREGIAGGTIGGGSGEFEIAGRAMHLLSQGKLEMLEVNMTNEAAGNLGMVCGGVMKVWLEYVGF